jgi:TPR repeat protein
MVGSGKQSKQIGRKPGIIFLVWLTTLFLLLPAASIAAEQAPQRVQPETAFALTAAEAEKGNSEAMLNLGHFYEQGLGTARNYTKAMEWYEKAGKAGQSVGYYNLAVCYDVGMGVTADAGKAQQNFQKAADLGMPLAMYKLSSIFILGTGTARDTAKGIAWLEKAANAGLAAASNDLGTIYLAGLLGRKMDKQKALSFFMKAAESGSLEAVMNIAAMYKDGVGVKANPAVAYRWYSIARRGGYAGEDVLRLIGLLEGSLSSSQVQQAQKEANLWLEKYARRQGSK